jgi:hypothetical protein
LENYIAFIQLKELSGGFRVISAEAVPIDSLQDKHAQDTRDIILSDQNDHPEDVWCLTMFKVDKCFLRVDSYGLGIYSELASIQDEAATLNGIRVGIIQMLNKEQ